MITEMLIQKKGFCNAIRKADIQGEVIENKFHITYFKLK